MKNNHYLILILILLGSLWVAQNFRLITQTAIEAFQSPGTLIQLLAKGPQDAYLTGWPYGSYYPFYYNNYPYYYPYYPYSRYPFYW